MPACPLKAQYGNWTEWSNCSLECITTSTQRSKKSRNRDCIANCDSVGLTETKECNVNLCQPDCPR